MGGLDGKNALITGAAGAIGLAIVERFVADGASVVAVDRVTGVANWEAVRWVQADVNDPVAMAEAARIAAAVGHLDVCVANAGVARREDFVDGSPDSWLEIIRTNLLGVMVTLQAACRSMVAAGVGGRLLATASTAGIQGAASASAYCASKAAVTGLMRALAVELGPHGITANAVAPGHIDTPMNAAYALELSEQQGVTIDEWWASTLHATVPLGRRGTPAEIAAAFAFLASDDAAFISGETVRIDGAELAV